MRFVRVKAWGRAVGKWIAAKGAGPLGGACLAVGVVALATHQADTALSKTPTSSWTLIQGLPQAVAAAERAGRRTLRLGLDGDIALPTPSAHGLVVSGRDTVAALASDQALADAAFLPRGTLRNLAPPPLAPSGDLRMERIRSHDDEALSRLAEASAPETPKEVDAEMAERLAIAFFEGRNRLESADADRELYCMTEAIYFEARGEELEGQLAVAEVVLNRVDSKYWPGTVCGVINQGGQRRTGCQFSYVCDGKSDKPTSQRAWRTAERIATLSMMGAPRRLTGHATHYHADYVSPRWAHAMERTAVIGTHLFFRRLIRFARKEADG